MALRSPTRDSRSLELIMKRPDRAALGLIADIGGTNIRIALTDPEWGRAGARAGTEILSDR